MGKTTLVIMAAGIGSRYGGGIKQMESFGPSGEIMMDYSVFDALEAGFEKVVFIIRKDMDEDFRRIIGDRIAKVTDEEKRIRIISELTRKFTDDEAYLARELKGSLQRTLLLELTIEHMTGKLVNEA